MSSIKHELILKLMSICHKSNYRVELPLPKGDWSSKDIRIEGAIEAISRLDNFSDSFNQNSILTHEGYSDKIADYSNNVDSMQLFEAEKENTPDLDYHATGMKIVEKIEERYGRHYLIWAVSVALNTRFINPLRSDIDLDSYFSDYMNQPDGRLKRLANTSNIPKFFPTESPEYVKDFMELAQELFPDVFVFSPHDLAKDDSVCREKLKKLYLLYLEIISSVPYLGVDTKFIKYVDSQVHEDTRIWGGSISRLRPFVDYRKGKDFEVAWKNWERYLGANLQQVLKNPDTIPEVLRDKIYYGICLGGEFFYDNPPLVILDSGDRHVDLLIRPDISKADRKRLLLKDFLESLSKMLLGKLLTDSSGLLRIPCYIGIENTLNCNPQGSCLAKSMLENFEPNKPVVLMCRPYNKTFAIKRIIN